ncbi:MAG: hypothetical protein V1793_19015 [Pseudomonadota bacterium]
MKRVLLFAAVLCLLSGMVLPVHALEVEFKGEFYVEGLINSNEGMLEKDLTSDYRQMRLRMSTDFNVTDSLSLTTRFDALETVWGTTDSAVASKSDQANIDFDRAYLTYKSSIGMFQVGRMLGGCWGTDFADDEIDADRIKWVAPLDMAGGKLYLLAINEKFSEYDKGTALSDEDNDKYYLGGVFKTQTYSAGLLSAFYNYNTAQDLGQAFAVKAFNDVYAKDLANNPGNSLATYIGGYAAGLSTGGYNPALGLPAAMGGAKDDPMNVLFTRGSTMSARLFLLSPYFAGKFGDFGISAELDYVWGAVEYEKKTLGKNPDRDVKALTYNVEGTYDMGPFTFQAGYAFASGDADYENAQSADFGKDEITSFGYLQPGVEWAKVFILNSDTHGMNTTLGNGIGNHVGSGSVTASTCMIDGYQMFYGGVDYAVNDKISLGLIAAASKADAVPNNEPGEFYDDDQGVECDLTFTWKITENLVYTAIGAYLDGGDYWKYRKDGKLNTNIKTDVYALYNQIKLTF